MSGTAEFDFCINNGMPLEEWQKLTKKGYKPEEIKAAIQSMIDRNVNVQKYYEQQDPENIFDPDVYYGIEKAPTLDTISAKELQGAELPPPIYIVKKLLTAGLSALAAPPKYGKSWLVLQLCLAVAAGTPFLDYDTNTAGCLYLALEDTQYRLRERMNKLLNGRPAPDCFDFATTASDLDNGLIAELEDFMSKHKNVKLIVIDTLQKVKSAKKYGESAYEADYRALAPLKTFADKYKLCVLLVHHLRKMKDETDPFNMMSGTNGILGSLDTALVMNRNKRSDTDTTFSVTGRDVEAQEKIIVFDKKSCKWNMKGDADYLAEQRARLEYDESPIVKTIKKLVETSPGNRWDGRVKDLMEAGKLIANTYLAPSVQQLGHDLQALDLPLLEYDGIVHTTTRNGNAGKNHCYYYQAVAFEELPGNEAIPF